MEVWSDVSVSVPTVRIIPRASSTVFTSVTNTGAISSSVSTSSAVFSSWLARTRSGSRSRTVSKSTCFVPPNDGFFRAPVFGPLTEAGDADDLVRQAQVRQQFRLAGHQGEDPAGPVVECDGVAAGVGGGRHWKTGL